MKNWFNSFFRKKEETDQLGFKVVREGKNISLYDQKTVEYMESKLRNPTQRRLLKLIHASDKIIIFKKEFNKDKPVKTPLTINGKTTELVGYAREKSKISEVSGHKKVQEAKKYFEIRNEPVGHLRCVGDLFFDFIDKEGNSTEVEYLGSGYIRIEKRFKDDAELKRPMEFLNWLHSLGIPEPLHNWMEDERRRNESDRRFLEWKSAAPKSLRKSMDFEQDKETMLRKLKSEIPDENELILRLCKLYGTGFYAWNPYPDYESIPQNILMEIHIDVLNKAFDTKGLDKEQKEGIARFLSSWAFSRKRKSDASKVSQQVKDELLAHLEEMGDDEKISQFRHSVMN